MSRKEPYQSNEPLKASLRDKARCNICPHLCSLEDGEAGLCSARVASGGKVIDQNYGCVTSLALDPIEKKPLARFMPGSKILSVGSYGCNLRCGFCQNASIAWADAASVPYRRIEPLELVDLALDAKADGNVGIAYTYNEPLVGFEYVRDASRLAHERGLVNVVVSNGMINHAPLLELAPLIDAANIDLKGFSQAFYDKVDGSFDCVRSTIETLAKEESCHLEVATLVIPGMNDNAQEIEAAAKWLASLDPSIVYHITRFFPCHLFADSNPTPIGKVYELADVAKRHLGNVCTGNC